MVVLGNDDAEVEGRAGEVKEERSCQGANDAMALGARCTEPEDDTGSRWWRRGGEEEIGRRDGEAGSSASVKGGQSRAALEQLLW